MRESDSGSFEDTEMQFYLQPRQLAEASCPAYPQAGDIESPWQSALVKVSTVLAVWLGY